MTMVSRPPEKQCRSPSDNKERCNDDNGSFHEDCTGLIRGESSVASIRTIARNRMAPGMLNLLPVGILELRENRVVADAEIIYGHGCDCKQATYAPQQVPLRVKIVVRIGLTGGCGFITC